MKRDPRLHRLSSEHHRALVLAQRTARACREGRVDAASAAELRRAFLAELSPHFVSEEMRLLPALDLAGEHQLAARVRREHRELRRLAERFGELDSLCAFADLLRRHVRFEERTLFPVCEKVLDDEVLDRLIEA